MSTFHAIVWIDHSQAQVMMFDREHVAAQRIKARSQHTPKHGHAEADKDFFHSVAEALHGVHEILITGPAKAKLEFHGFCQKHVQPVAKAVVDVITTDHPTDAQLVAMARQYFLRYDKTATDPSRA